MRTVSSATTEAWKASYKGGSRRPMVRATIQRLDVKFVPYDLSQLRGTNSHEGRTGTGILATMPFGQGDRPVELPNIKTFKWSRSIDQDVATATLELWNTEVLPLGQAPDDPDSLEFERPGWFTFNRGVTAAAQGRWGYASNGWQDFLVPDRIVRTYEGYGYDTEAIPENDTHLYPSGVWRIDDVTYTAKGTISVKLRDIGSALVDQIMYPPVIPFPEYPLLWERYHNVDNPDRIVTTGSTAWFRPTFETDSSIPITGSSTIHGHHGSHAFDSSGSTFWMSVGNATPTQSGAYEYVQGKFSARTVSGVKFRAWGGPYTVFVSVMVGSTWQGSSTIPYRPTGSQPNTHANIRFIGSFRVGKNATVEWKFPKAYANAVKVRFTVHDLYNSGIGKPFPYRAGAYDIQVLGGSTVTTTVDGGTHLEGNYGDYTDIVKWLCAWGGFYWPSHTTDLDFVTESDNSKTYMTYVSEDPVFPTGRVWGDFEQTGTNGPAALGVQIWDKKPLMDGIAYIRDIVGFNFWIDETGGVVWRSPNIWAVGNYLSSTGGGPNTGRTETIIEIDEVETLTDLSVTLSSRNVRERVFVANTTGNVGWLAAGFNPYPSGLRRVGGWTDQNFETNEECVIMADLITIRQMFSYRTDRVRIPANPAIQIDDQVRIYERTTSETYYHYVKSIESSIDLVAGTWYYDLGTHWLGEEPFEKWLFDPNQLQQETQDYLRTIGKI